MFRVLLFRDSDAWIAQCLELDVCAPGATEEQAVRNLDDTLRLHLALDAKQGREGLVDVRWTTPDSLEQDFKGGKPWPCSKEVAAKMSVRESVL